MKLETEFRLRLQLMQQEQAWGNSSCDRSLANRSDVPSVKAFLPTLEPTPAMWVKLMQTPSLFSSDEALLLCPVSDYQWLAWVPDYGEIVLDREEFYWCWDETH